jgi:putative FmdB family regulatory protein
MAPLYDYRCDICGHTQEVVQLGEDVERMCCERAMRKLIGLPAMIKVEGEGLPARRKWLDNWTPDSPPLSIGSNHGERY